MTDKLQRGDIVELLEKPTGCTSQHYDLTVGDFYRFNEYAGSCVITTSNEPGETAMYHHGRVQKASGTPSPARCHLT